MSFFSPSTLSLSFLSLISLLSFFNPSKRMTAQVEIRKRSYETDLWIRFKKGRDVLRKAKANGGLRIKSPTVAYDMKWGSSGSYAEMWGPSDIYLAPRVDLTSHNAQYHKDLLVPCDLKSKIIIELRILSFQFAVHVGMIYTTRHSMRGNFHFMKRLHHYRLLF